MIASEPTTSQVSARSQVALPIRDCYVGGLTTIDPYQVLSTRLQHIAVGLDMFSYADADPAVVVGRRWDAAVRIGQHVSCHAWGTSGTVGAGVAEDRTKLAEAVDAFVGVGGAGAGTIDGIGEEGLVADGAATSAGTILGA